jgi:hypothetical protein
MKTKLWCREPQLSTGSTERVAFVAGDVMQHARLLARKNAGNPAGLVDIP